MRTRPSVFLVVLVVALVVLAGCTGGSGPGGTDATPTTPVPDGSTGGSGGAAGSGGGGSGSDSSGSATAQSAPKGTVTVHFINVGQGDSTLVVGPTGETMLVDTADFRDDGEYVIDYLEAQGITRIDFLVSTHADADHIGGNADVIEHFETQRDGVGAVYDPGITATTATYERYLDAVEAHEVPLYLTLAGDDVPVDGLSVQVLGPPQPYLASEERNENSIVLRVSFGETSFLLTGDAGPVEEPYLVETYGSALDVTVLKAGHHGSRSSTSAALLEATTPQAVVISSDYDSRYGHPHQEVLQRISDRRISTYWTATHGTVVATSDGRTVEVATQAAAITAATALRTDVAVAPGTGGPVVVRDAYAGSEGDSSVTAAGPRIEITTIHEDAAGNDAENLVDEYVVLTNRGDASVNLSGWILTDESGATYTVPDGVVLQPGASITVRTGAGTDSSTTLYWNAGRPVWNNDGDTVTLIRSDGGIVAEVRY